MNSSDRRKALSVIYYGPKDLRLEERSIPEIGDDEALLKVSSAGICGTDLRIFHGNHRKFTSGVTRTLGHEVVGEIDQVGSRVTGLEVGERVFVAPNMGCGHCKQCITGNNNLCADYSAFGVTIDGAFAEYMRLPSEAIRQGNLIPIGPEIDSAVGALIEPFACVLRGQDVLAIQPGEIVLIIGAGPIGMMHMMLAQLRGAKEVIVSEVNEARGEQARKLGANLTVNPKVQNLAEVILDITGGEGANAIVVAAPSHEAQQDAVQLASIKGRINFFGGLPKDNPTIIFDSNEVHYKELIVTGTTGSSTYDCRQAAAIIESGRINLEGIVSNRLPLERARDGFELADSSKALKVILEPSSNSDDLPNS